MNNILRGNAWSLSGHSLLLKQWTPLFPTQLDTISKVPVWVLFHNLDPHLWSASALSKIASKIGTPLYADPVTTNKERLSFARVMVEVDLSGPLPDNVVINSPFTGQIIQDVEYEWLPYYCTHCKKLGHEKRFCKQPKQKAKPKAAISEPSCSTDGHKDTETDKLAQTVVEPVAQKVVETVAQKVDDHALGSMTLTPVSGGGCQPEAGVTAHVPLLASERASLDHPEHGGGDERSRDPIPVSLNQFGILGDVVEGLNELVTVGAATIKHGTVIHQLSIPKHTWAEQEVLNNSSQWIHLSLTHGSHVVEATFVYGFNQPAQRLPLWDFLVNNVGCTNPWIVLGDVNCVRTTEERISSDPPNDVAMNEFNEAIANAGLAEVRTQGCCFTWTNKQDYKDRKWVRLDRALVNASWLLVFPDSYAEALTAGISDHSPVVLTLEASTPPKNYSFKYLNCWSQDKQFLPLVRAEWGTYIKGCAMYKLVQHLKRLKGKLRGFHREHYANITAKVKNVQQQLHTCQEKLQLDPHNRALCLEEEHLSEDYCKFKTIELSIAFQRAKEFDIKMGDASTTYFSSKVAARRNSSNIRKVVDNHGTVCNAFPDISKAFLDYYISLLGTAGNVTKFDSSIMPNGHILTPTEGSPLLEPITPAEIKSALFSIDANKSPGPDGYSSGFFKDAWDTIHDSFITAILDFFKTGKLLKEVNSTLITLIPKGTSPNTVMDYRPISCCTTIYKTISKILTSRLHKIMPHIVGLEQAAFVADCYSGLVPNTSKTNIYFAGVRTDVKSLIIGDTDYVEDNFPFKYLGVPLHSSRLTRDLLQPLLAKITGKLGHWTSLQLSYASRVNLLNSVIFGIEAYWCASLLLPKGVIKTLETECRKFLWGSTANRRMNFFSWNKKLCFKSTTIWMQWSTHYIFKLQSCWDLDAASCVSPLWAQILRIRDEFVQNMGSSGAAKHCFQKWMVMNKFPLHEAYQCFHGVHPEPKWMQPIIDSIVIPKHAFTATLAAHHGLATVDNICTRGMAMVNRCTLCYSAAENTRHLFFVCPFSNGILRRFCAARSY
ncbi:uncharacterized protein LOC141639227 [Silene latifolia]|uniref:uncharacterized protein LOC141639227 n=1 Tax=Silene latifolia TaxID=37657 RepID=UPI003D774846